MKSVSESVNKAKRGIELLETFIDDINVKEAMRSAHWFRREAMTAMVESLRLAGEAGVDREEYIGNMGYFFERINQLCNILDQYVIDMDQAERLDKKEEEED